MKNIFILLIIGSIIGGFFYFNKNEKKTLNTNTSNMITYKSAYFAGGCFWCMEGIFEAQSGISEAVVGYIGGDKITANYKEVSSGVTKHREGVKVIYNPEIINYETLVELFWTQIDPTDPDGQFADKGFQYTTAMYYLDEKEKNVLEKSKEILEKSGKFDKPIVTKILPFITFFEAEEYHQDYYKKSSLQYETYKKGSGRKDFIEENWENTIKKLEDQTTSYLKGYIEYDENVLKNATQKNIVLFFHADWCPTCKAFEKKILDEEIPDNILILKVNYDKELELRKKYNIVTQTSFVLVDNKGNLKKRWIGARGIDDIIKKIGDLLINNKGSKTYTKEELKARLTPLQYKVTQEGGTEPPFDNEYWDNKEEGIYVDIIDGTALFSSTDKYESGTGWPAFTKTIDENIVGEEEDNTFMMNRTKVTIGDSHLGHVFEDGPVDKGGLRYCINSAALKFIPKDELKGSEYEKYLFLFGN